MNISLKWLKDYVNIDLTPEELAATLTSIGLECGGIEKVDAIRGGLEGLVVGRVLTCEDHPDSDHLHITTVDLGGGRVEQIVCGAPNVAAGQAVIVATVGTTLYDGDKEFQIKKSKIRGVQSMGMICAEDEIGVGHSHDGIIVIPDDQTPAPGTPAATYYKLESDYVLEVDLTPNRIDAASHYGVARDLSAKLAAEGKDAGLHRPSDADFKVDSPEAASVSVNVQDTEGCVRYCGVTIDGVEIKESPEWLRTRLETVGLRPINNVVDITNYVLHAFCQPLHAFDRNRIAGDTINVRTVEAGTKFTTLDGVERTLDAADLMICDAEKPLCMAGVFGGLDSGVTEGTTSVFLESACFNSTRVRRTARRHGLSTDSSFRFERGVDPNGCMYGLKIAALLIQQLAGGKISGKVYDVYPAPVEPARVELSTDYMDRLIGMHLPDEAVNTILAALGIETLAADAASRSLAVPTYRVDVTRPCDVVEEILRIFGYNNIPMPGQVRSSLSYKTDTDTADDLRRKIAEQLTAAGFREILNNSLTATSYYDGLETWPLERRVRLLNPLSQDLGVMRATLLFGGLESIAHNVNRKSANLALYETGNVYEFNPEADASERPLAPYREDSRLALWLTGDVRPASWIEGACSASFYHLRAAVDNVLARLGISPREVALTNDVPADIYAAGMTLSTRGGKVLGTMGMVSKAILAKMDIKQPVYYAELDWTALVKLAAKRRVSYTELPKTQPVRRDLALLVDTSVTMAAIESAVREAERRLLRGVELFDVYEGKNLPEGKKSYAIAITLQDSEKTLNDKAIDAVMTKVMANLTKKVGAQLR